MSDQGLAMSARPGPGNNGPAALGGRAIVRAGALSTGALVVLGASRLAHGSLISHATGASTYGLIGSLIGITYVAALFVPAGLASAMAKYVAQHRGRDDAAGAGGAYRFLRRLSDASALALGGLAALVADLLYPVSVSQTIQVGLLAAVFSAYSVDKAAFYGFDRVARYSVLEFAGSGLAIVTTVIVIIVDSTWYLAPLILGYAIVVAGSRLSLRGTATAPANPVDRKEFLTFAGLAAVGAGSAAGLLQGTPLLANWFTDARDVGYLVAAVTLVSPLYLLPRVLGLALFPAMSHARGEGAEHAVRRSADLSMRGTMVVLAPVFAAALPLAGPILAVYGGGQYADGAPELRLLLLATYTAVVAIGPINALSSGTVREARIPVTFALLGCVLGLLLVAPLGWAFGGAGVAAAYLVATVLTSAGPMAAAARKWTLPWTGVVVRSALAIGAGLAITAGAEALHTSWGLSFVTALACAAVAAALLARDGKALLIEART